MTYTPNKDKEYFRHLLKPYLESKGLPTDEEFVEELTAEFLKCTKEIVHVRKDYYLNKKDNQK